MKNKYKLTGQDMSGIKVDILYDINPDELHNLEHHYRNSYYNFRIEQYNTKIICKRCKSHKIQLTEEINTSYYYSWEDNFKTCSLSEDCDYLRVRAYCEICKYDWTLRKIKTIEELKK